MSQIISKATGCGLILLSLALFGIHGAGRAASNSSTRFASNGKSATPPTIVEDPARIETFRKAYDAEVAKKYSDAAKVLRGLPKDSQDYLLNMRVAWLLYSAKDYKGAQKQFEIASRQGADAFEPKTGLLLALIGQEKYGDVEKIARQVLSQDSDNYYANLRLAYVLRLQSKLPQAFRINQRMLALHPADTNFLIEQALVLTAQRRYVESREYYQKVLLINPDHSIANQALSLAVGTRARDFTAEAFLQAYRQELEQKYPEAIEALTSLQSYKPYEYFAHLRLGWVQYLAGKYAESKKSYEQAVKLAPKGVEPLVGLLLPLLAQENYTEAAQIARQVVQLDPTNYYGRLRLGYALRKLGQFDEAEKSNELMLKRYPTDVLFLLEQGLTMNGLRKSEEAVRLYRQVQLLAPDNATAKAGLSKTSLNGKE